MAAMSFGPGGYLSRGNKFAQLLQSMPDPNNGTHMGGLGNALQKGLMGLMMGGESQKDKEAQALMTQAMKAMQGSPASTIQWDQPTRPDGTGSPTTPVSAVAPNRQLAMQLLASNERTAPMSYQMQMSQMERADAREANKVTQLSPQEVAQLGLPTGTVAQRNANGQISVVSKPDKVTQPSSVQEFEYAKSQGYTGSFEDFKKMGSASSGQETFGNTPIWGQDANGNPVLMQPSNRGGLRVVPLPDGVVPQRGQTSRVDLGDKFGVLDANGTLIGYIPKGIAPDRKIDDGRVITLPGVPGGQPQMPPHMPPAAPAPGAMPQQQSMQMPPGAQGSPLPQQSMSGGVAIQNLPKTPEQLAKEASAAAVKGRAADVVVEDIGRAMSLMDTATLPAAGLGASTASMIPGTAARDVRGLIDTVKGNVGFDRLQQMRDSSPTGGALGAINTIELQTLQAVLGNLEQSQSPEQLRYNLGRLNNMYLDIIHGPGNGPPRKTLGNAAASPATASAPPAPGTMDEGYVFLGGDPADPKSWQRQ